MKLGTSYKRRIKLHPIVRRMELIGMKPKSNGIPGKYLIGYKIASKMKREWKNFRIYYKGTAQQANEEFKQLFQIDWTNPTTFTW